MWVALFKQTYQAPMLLISPSSLPHTGSTSAEWTAVIHFSLQWAGFLKKPWTTNTDTHSFGTVSSSPIKGVYCRLCHDVIPTTYAKLITTKRHGMYICVYAEVYVKDSACQSKPLFLMNPELEWRIIKCAAKGQTQKCLFFPFSSNSAVTYQSLENNQVVGMQGDVEDLSITEGRTDSESVHKD